MSRRSWAAFALSSLLAVAGSALVGGAAGRGLHAKSEATVVPLTYSETQTCAGCPSDTALDSVEVQARQGSTLFVLNGRWPASIDGVHVNLCLNVNDIGVSLTPHGSRNAFEAAIVRRTPSTNATAPPAGSISIGVQGPSLLIDLTGAAQPSVPVHFDVAICRGADTLERLPRSGELIWDGQGPPRPASQP